MKAPECGGFAGTAVTGHHGKKLAFSRVFEDCFAETILHDRLIKAVIKFAVDNITRGIVHKTHEIDLLFPAIHS